MKVVVPDRARAHLASVIPGVEFTFYRDLSECMAQVPDADILWFHLPRHDLATVLYPALTLRWVALDIAGLDGWPLAEVARKGLLLTNAAGVRAIPIAECAVMGLLALVKGLPELVRAQDRRTWLTTPPALRELHGRRALIYGFGHIGRAIAERLRPFGVQITGVRRNPGSEHGVVGVGLWEHLLPEADLLVVSAPRTAETEGTIGRAQLDALPQGAFIANVSRGGLIDEAALVECLHRGHVSGAYLDVTSEEPLPESSPLWSVPNILITPHSSWASDQLTVREASLFLDNLHRYRRGDRLLNLVDLAAGY